MSHPRIGTEYQQHCVVPDIKLPLCTCAQGLGPRGVKSHERDNKGQGENTKVMKKRPVYGHPVRVINEQLAASSDACIPSVP